MCTCVHKNERCVVDVQDTRYEEALGIRRAKSYAHPAPKRRERLHKAMEKQTKVVAPQRAPLLYWRNPRGGKDNREGEEYHAEKRNSLNYMIKNQFGQSFGDRRSPAAVPGRSRGYHTEKKKSLNYVIKN